jgi:hypothetical protein
MAGLERQALDEDAVGPFPHVGMDHREQARAHPARAHEYRSRGRASTRMMLLEDPERAGRELRLAENVAARRGLRSPWLTRSTIWAKISQGMRPEGLASAATSIPRSAERLAAEMAAATRAGQDGAEHETRDAVQDSDLMTLSCPPRDRSGRRPS